MIRAAASPLIRTRLRCKHGFHVWLHAPLLLILLFVAGTLYASEVADVVRLRTEGKLTEAESQARERWAEELSEPDRVELATELIHIYAEQALVSAGRERAALFARGDEVCNAVLEAWGDRTRSKFIELERTHLGVVRASVAREDGNTNAATTQLTAAVRQLSSISEHAERQQAERRLSPQVKATNETLSDEELTALSQRAAYYLAKAEHQLALCHPKESPASDNLLLQASKRLAGLTYQKKTDELVWKARIELLGCQYDLGNPHTAQRLSEAWLAQNPPAGIAAQIREMPAIKRSEPKTASTGETSNAVPSQTTPSIVPPPASASTAKASVSKESAAAAQQAGDHKTAMEQFRQLAMARPEDQESPELHRQAILAAASFLRASSPTDRESVAKTYESLLVEHLRVWPHAATANEVRVWLGKLFVRRREWANAISTLQPVALDANTAADAVPMLVEAYEQEIRRISPRDSQAAAKRTQLLATATRSLQPIITGSDNRWPNPWSAAQRQAALGLGCLHIRYGEASSPYATQLMTAMLRDAAADSDEKEAESVVASGHAILVASLMRSGRTDEALLFIERVAAASAESLYDSLAMVMDKITETPTSDAARRERLSQVALKLLGFIEPKSAELEAASRDKLRLYRAAALAASGDREQALTQYAALVVELPNNGDVQEQYAALLGDTTVPEELQKSLEQWKGVERRSRVGGDRWRRARHARIEVLSRLGETAEAAKLDRLTRAQYPDWDADQAK